jgi:hypothetical protein
VADLDGRPALAGIARRRRLTMPATFITYIPNASGGGQMVPFTAAEAGRLRRTLAAPTPQR